MAFKTNIEVNLKELNKPFYSLDGGGKIDKGWKYRYLRPVLIWKDFQTTAAVFSLVYTLDLDCVYIDIYTHKHTHIWNIIINNNAYSDKLESWGKV